MSIPTPSAELLDLVEQGDRTATTKFVELYGDAALQLVWMLFSRLSREDCQEIAQDAMLNVLSGLRNYDRNQPFRPWFVTIVRRRAQDFTDKNANEWVPGALGSVPAHVSFDEVTGPNGPSSLKNQVIAATVRELDEEKTPADLGRPDDTNSNVAAQASALKQWIGALDEAERVLLEHHLYGASWVEVAAKLASLGHDVTVGTARVRGYRLIERAKRELAKR